MNAGVIALRLVHIILGVYWAGAVFFFVTFVQPSIRDAGPDGMKVAQQIVRRGYLNILPAVGGLTILAGLVLYWRDAQAMAGVWMSTGTGRGFTVGATAAIIGLVVGVFGVRRPMLKVIALSQGLPQLAEGPERQARVAEIDRLRRTAVSSSQWVAGLLLIAVGAMAVARYL